MPSALVLTLLLAGAARADLGAYVERPEPAWEWEKTGESVEGGLQSATVDLVSQVWRGETWEHEMRIFRPTAAPAGDVAIVVVSGVPAGWRKDDSFERRLAVGAGVPVAILTDVPNQPLFFGKREDDLLAHTFLEFLETGEPDRPLPLPMTKSVVAAMDAIEALSVKEWGRRIERFVVTGASKRGWTAWLAAVVDARVAGIVPVVFDNLNFPAQMRNQKEVWGAYSDELRDYTLRGLQKYIDTPRGRELVAMVDPHSHRDRLERVSKLLVHGTNDPYWTVDAIRFYWDDLEGEKTVLYVPNGGHGIAGEDRVAAATAAFARRVRDGEPMPSLEVEAERREGSVEMRIRSDEEPTSVRIWTAASDHGDFRRARFESRLAGKGAGPHRVGVDLPPAGAVAFFADADYGEGDEAFTLSTPIRLVRVDP